jgi:hypothetical protein
MADLGNLCIDCGCDTAFGSGNFVNRVPADDGENSGFMCADCQAMPCDTCNEPTTDWEFTPNGDLICIDCLNNQPTKGKHP